MNDISQLLIEQQGNLKALQAVISNAGVTKDNKELIEAVYAVHSTAVKMKIWLIDIPKIQEYDPIN